MYTTSEALRYTENGDGAIVLDVQRGRIFRLNGIAFKVLKKLRTGAVVSEIVLEISQQCSVPFEIVDHDVDELLSTLERYGLIRRSLQPE